MVRRTLLQECLCFSIASRRVCSIQHLTSDGNNDLESNGNNDVPPGHGIRILSVCLGVPGVLG